MQRIIADFSEAVIGRDRQEHVAGLHADLELVEILVLQIFHMLQRAFHQRFRAGFAIFFEQMLFEAAGVHADADGAAIGLGGVHHFADAFAAADVARVDAQAGGARVSRFQRALVVEMDVRHDRHLGGAGDGTERRGGFLGRAAHPDDIGAHILTGADLIDRRAGVFGGGVGHGLHGDRGIPAHRHFAHHDLPALAAGDVTPGTHAHANRLLHSIALPDSTGMQPCKTRLIIAA